MLKILNLIMETGKKKTPKTVSDMKINITVNNKSPTLSICWFFILQTN